MSTVLFGASLSPTSCHHPPVIQYVQYSTVRYGLLARRVGAVASHVHEQPLQASSRGRCSVIKRADCGASGAGPYTYSSPPSSLHQCPAAPTSAAAAASSTDGNRGRFMTTVLVIVTPRREWLDSAPSQPLLMLCVENDTLPSSNRDERQFLSQTAISCSHSQTGSY